MNNYTDLRYNTSNICKNYRNKVNNRFKKLSDNIDINSTDNYQFITSNNIDIFIDNDTSYNKIYQIFSDEILTIWFSNSRESKYYDHYNNLPLLQNISDRARHKIWIDIFRTYAIFEEKSSIYKEIIQNNEVLLTTLLCRTLCISSHLLGGWYCQGLNFIGK